jgi:hypothetical protein
MFKGELSSLWTTRVFTEVAARKSLATQLDAFEEWT